MENRTNRNQSEEFDNTVSSSMPDAAALKKKWGVSEEEVKDAIANVGTDRSNIEEYLVNKKWQQKNEPSFQKRELNEDETY